MISLNQMKLTCLLSISMAVAVFVGCGETRPETNDVTGVVMIDGKPLPEVAVRFTPKSISGGRILESTALTDANGRYQLVYKLPTSHSNTPITGSGAVRGVHKVTVSDYKMMAEHLPRPGRVPLEYTKEASTPLQFEVTEGKQTIDIMLNK